MRNTNSSIASSGGRHRITSVVVALLAIAVLYSPRADAADPIVIKFSHVTAPDTPKGKAALRFKESAERRTNGAVRVEVYPNGELYKDKDEIAALLENQVQILAPSLAKLAPLGVPEIEVFDLPYIFPGKDLLRVVTQGAIGKGLLKKLEARGVVGLAFWDNGFKVMSANRPLRKPEDFGGLKMRVQPSDVLKAQMRAVGADPVPMAFSEVRAALKSGKIDGTENPPSNLYSQRMHEAQKHVTVSNHGYLGYAVIANKTFWDGLPVKIRVHLQLAILDATIKANLYAEMENKEALEKVRASGKSDVYVLTPDEREEWRRALLPVHREMEQRVGSGILQAIYREASYIGYRF